MRKLIFLMALMILVLSSFSYAKDAAYIVTAAGNENANVVNALIDMGFTIGIIDDNNLGLINFSDYAVSVIDEGNLVNTQYLPINSYPSIVFNREMVNNFYWTSLSGSSSGRNYFNVVNITNPITQGFPTNVKLYTSTSPAYYYLVKNSMALGAKTIITPTALNLDAAVATFDKGARLKTGYSNAKGVFFGLAKDDFWTNYSVEMFKNSINWLTQDSIAPQIISLTNTTTNQSASILWSTDYASNYTLFYGESVAFGNVKSNNSFALSHSVIISGLNENQNYYYKIKSCNANGQCSNSSVYYFKTKDFTAPYFTSIPWIINSTTDSVNISFITNENSLASIFYGLTSENLNNSIAASGYATEFNIFIGNLAENTRYYSAVEVCDESNNCRNHSMNFASGDSTPPEMPQNLRLHVINSDNSINVTWDPVTDADHYHIYISINDTFHFINPVQVTTNYYLDSNANSVQQRDYIVRAVDAAGNEGDNNYSAGKFSLPLKAGYNLVSFPLTPFDNNINIVMHQDANYHPISEIKRFNADTKQFETITYNTASNSWSNSFTTLDAVKGYFFKSNSDAEFTIVGIAENQQIDLRKGLNLVGLSLFDTKSVGEAIPVLTEDGRITFNIPTIQLISEVSSRTDNGRYLTQNYYPSQSNWIGDSFLIEPGKAYWVKAIYDTSFGVQ